MTERKPPGVGFESWIDQQIRAAEERGAFDDLPGTGKPLPGLDRPLDEDWWVRQKIRSEGLPPDVLLPPGLQLRKEVARLPETVQGLSSENAVREVVRDLNRRIAEWIRVPTGPYVPVGPVRVEEVVEAWQEARRTPPPSAVVRHAPPADGPARDGWWRRLLTRLREARGR